MVNGTSQDLRVPGELDQISSDHPVIAPDRKTVGWLVEMPNCCTSYPIPTIPIVFNSTKIVRRIHDGMMIYKWQFLDGSLRIATSSERSTGTVGIHQTLYDSLTGKLLKHVGWRRQPTTSPSWGDRLRHTSVTCWN